MNRLHRPLTAAVFLLLSLFEIYIGTGLSAEPTERLRLKGLQAPVEIMVDQWGVAHIYAENESDLFFAQGYYAARDRTFQFEIWRRQATGTVAEVLGKRELDRDIGARLLRFRGDLNRELNHYHPRGEQIIRSFTNGINAWIDQTRRNPELLPVEFRLLGIQPGRWTPEVVVSRHHRYRRLGYRVGDQRPWSRWRSRRAALPRPVRNVGNGTLLPAVLLTSQSGIGASADVGAGSIRHDKPIGLLVFDVAAVNAVDTVAAEAMLRANCCNRLSSFASA